MEIIKLENVTKSFVSGNETKKVLDNASLVIKESEFVAIVGPSGSGKSTLLTIVGALQKPTSGNITINNKDLNEMKSNQLSDFRFNDIGFILQGSNLVPYLTIYEQFILKYKYAKKKVDKQRIDFILDKLSIQHIKNKYPDDISGGERQRAAIGVALVLNPKIILADEPTASLDTEKAYDVMEILKDISKEVNTTIIIVTHDRRMLTYCDRVLGISDGVVCQEK